MKNKIFLFFILIFLFVFGLLIYDFSDDIDSVLTSHNWYLNDNDEFYILSLKNQEFSYFKEDGGQVIGYQDCSNYQYNNNVSMIKFKCDSETKKIYITTYDDDRLILSENGNEQVFFSSKELALIDKFKKDNDLSEEEYEELFNIDINKDKYITFAKFNKLYKSKKKYYVGLVTNDIHYQNVYNYQVLNKLINNSSKDFYLLDVSGLNSKDLKSLNKLTKKDNYDNEIYIYEIGKKKINNKVIINTVNKKDLNNYQNI